MENIVYNMVLQVLCDSVVSYFSMSIKLCKQFCTKAALQSNTKVHLLGFLLFIHSFLLHSLILILIHSMSILFLRGHLLRYMLPLQRGDCCLIG